MVAVTFASIGLVTVFLALGGPPDDSCVRRGNCYCEPVGESIIRQPLNTWSSLAFVGLGLWSFFILLRAARRTRNRRGLLHLFLFPAITFWMGPAAFVYHMTVRASAGLFDQTSIVILLCYAVLINAQRVFGWPRRLGGLLSAYFPGVLSIIGSTAITNTLGLDFEAWALSDLIVAVLSTCTIVFTVVSWSGKRAPRHFGERPSPARILFPVLIVAAMTIWVLSASGGPLCHNGFSPGHAAWHILAALALGAAFYGWVAHPRGVHLGS